MNFVGPWEELLFRTQDISRCKIEQMYCLRFLCYLFLVHIYDLRVAHFIIHYSNSFAHCSTLTV